MMPQTHRLFPLAYHFILQAYGRWLPGDPRGWHRRGDGAYAPPRPGDEVIHAIARELQRHPTATIAESMRAPIATTISALALDRGWRLHEIATTPSHLHVVITAPMKAVDVLDIIRDGTRRALADLDLIEPSCPFWSGGGSFRMVRTVRGLERARRYVALHRPEEVAAEDLVGRPVASRR